MLYAWGMLVGPWQSVPPRPGRIVGGSFTPPLIEPSRPSPAGASNGLLKTVNASQGPNVHLALAPSPATPILSVDLTIPAEPGIKVIILVTCELLVLTQQSIHMAVVDDLGNTFDETDPEVTTTGSLVWSRTIEFPSSPGDRTFTLTGVSSIDGSGQAFNVNMTAMLVNV